MVVAACGSAVTGTRRIRLVAYGARLESVLGASPRGFESPILRHLFSGELEMLSGPA